MNTSLSSLLQLACKSDNTNDSFAIDVGAHYGEFSSFIISTGFFDRVISFEPNPESYLKLVNEVSSTDKCGYQAINSALSDTSGTLDLYCDKDTATASLLNYDSGYLANGTIEKCAVPVITLDDYLTSNPVAGKLQLLKIDTQGNDLSVIKGGGGTIAAHRPIIQTEFIYTPLYEGQCTPSELSEALFLMDYEMYSLNNLHVTSEGRLAFCDAIFIPKELDIPVTQKYSCIDDQISFMTQIDTLTKICAERLAVINVLDAEVQRLNKREAKTSLLSNILIRVKSWVL